MEALCSATSKQLLFPSAVHPIGGHGPPTSPTRQRVKPVTKLQLAGALYSWGMWGFIMLMVSSQFLGIIWNTVETKQYLYYGRDPTLGPYAIGGFNDEPYSDRMIVCLEEGRNFRAAQVSEVLSKVEATAVVDRTGASVNGYRVVKREEFTLNTETLNEYTSVCTQVAKTIDAIFDACSSLGYNVTRDSLRIVNGVDSSETYLILNSLPIIMMPFWDGSRYGRFAVPGWDGNACMFRLAGQYFDDFEPPSMMFYTVNRSIREAKTAEWIRRPGGVWKNDWYEDLKGEKWYSDVVSSDQKSKYGIPLRQFDMLSGKELDCVNTDVCKDTPAADLWGSKFSTIDYSIYTTSVAIANGNRYGVFLYEKPVLRVVKSVYDWETLLSNASVGLLLLHWMYAMYALQNGYHRGQSDWYNAGIGCLANSKSFNLLPIMLLPRLTTTLAAFWTVGCEFEGQQKEISETWFVMYPAILECMLLYFSLLNLAAKILRRRISDAPFGPTVLLLCLLHRFRLEIARSGWFGIDGRVTTLIQSNEMDAFTIIDFFTTNTPFRLNGNVQFLIIIKLVVLALNFLPLMLTRGSTRTEAELKAAKPLRIEKALAIRCWNVGGLGRSAIYESEEGNRTPSGRISLNSYELVRLGYVVFGDCFMISILDWEVVCPLSLFRSIYHLWNHRVALFTLSDVGDGKTVSVTSQMYRLDSPSLQHIPCGISTGDLSDNQALDRVCTETTNLRLLWLKEKNDSLFA